MEAWHADGVQHTVAWLGSNGGPIRLTDNLACRQACPTDTESGLGRNVRSTIASSWNARLSNEVLDLKQVMRLSDRFWLGYADTLRRDKDDHLIKALEADSVCGC